MFKLAEETMFKLTAAVVISLFAGFVYAQQTPTVQKTETQTTTNATTWHGTLVDARCQATHTENKETTNTDAAGNTTTTKTETKTIECPATMTSTSFELLTPEGRYIRFDDPSNARIVETVKNNKKWAKFLNDHEPLKVQVVGKTNGELIVLESIQ